ncbi:flagellar motor switch protein FliN [Cellulomonas sp. NTE-D12]|uniref:flagellar motor switch protein FliN n=1 Tax=Cellulomonas sp. NTE-D12 TaxID=2962632 RepID=UPI003081AFC0|nr:hypothetical protein CELD12_29130 [Cellulomonas sp. NTE-D12]
MNATTVSDLEVQAVAGAAAAMVPSTVPLVAVPAAPGDRPDPDAVAVVASFVGSPSAELVVVAEAVVAELTAAGVSEGTPVALTDALRPALEAAAARLGTGVLESARTDSAGSVLSDDSQLFALQAAGTTLGWFAVRVRGGRVPVAGGASAVPTPRASMRVLYDVDMTLTAELGRARLPLRQVLELAPGTVLELDRAAGAPADVMINGRLIARGEVVVVDEEYGVRITEIVSGVEADR